MSERLVHFRPGLPGLPEELLLARDRGEVLFLTGAGVSTPAPSSLPGFRKLVVDIYQQLDPALARAMDEYTSQPPPADWRPHSAGLDAKQKTELKRFSLGEYDVALGMLERRVAGGMREAAAQVLGSTTRPNALHKALDRLGRRYGQPFIATTNFDRLHEEAAGLSSTAQGSHGLLSLPRPSRRSDFQGIFHIHGALPARRGDPTNLILTDQDFGDVYMRRRTASDFIYDAVRIFHLVIIGYSFSDAPFRYLLNAVAGDSAHFPDLKSRYAIVPRSGDDETVQEEWSARFIEPICYDDRDNHAQLQELLRAWADSVPTPGSTAWEEKALKRLCGRRPSEASPEDRSLFAYILRRSLLTERTAILASLGAGAAHPDWLTEAISITRERGT